MQLCVLISAAAPLAALASGDLVGTWRMPALSAKPIEECINATMGFRADGSMISISGDQVVTGVYRTEPAGENAYLLLISELSSNGQPNCQGIDAETVLANHIERAYIVVTEDALTLHFGDSPDAPSYTMTRE